MIGVSLTLNAVEDIPQKLKVHWKDVTIAFSVVFLISTVVIFTAMRDMNVVFTDILPMKGYQVISHIVFTIAIVAASEEIILEVQ